MQINLVHILKIVQPDGFVRTDFYTDFESAMADGTDYKNQSPKDKIYIVSYETNAGYNIKSNLVKCETYEIGVAYKK